MKKQILSICLLTLFASLAHAHNGDAVTHGFSAGFLHPINGWDHLLMMVAVGLMAAQSTGRMRWLLPATFIGMMLLGSVLGLAAGALGQLELFITATILLTGAALLFNQGLANWSKIGLVGLFALPHGWAHGVEIGMQSMSTLFGVLVATGVLHGLGYGLNHYQSFIKLPVNRLVAYFMLIAGGLLLVN